MKYRWIIVLLIILSLSSSIPKNWAFMAEIMSAVGPSVLFTLFAVAATTIACALTLVFAKRLLLRNSGDGL
jgi:hypothetical protein